MSFPDSRLPRGWFGEPWPSSICLKQDEDGADLVPYQWNYEMQVPTPVGTPCIHCNEEIILGDRGQLTVFMNAQWEAIPSAEHRECTLRAVMGPLAHLEKRCRCFGGTDHDTPGLTSRQEALQVWDFIVNRRFT